MIFSVLMVLPFIWEVHCSDVNPLAILHPQVQGFSSSFISQLTAWRPIEYIFNVTHPVDDAAQMYYDYGYAKSAAVGFSDPDWAARILQDAFKETFGRLTPLKLAQAMSGSTGQLLYESKGLTTEISLELSTALANSVKKAVASYPYEAHLAALENAFIEFAFPRGYYTKDSVIPGHQIVSKFLHLVVGDIQTI